MSFDRIAPYLQDPLVLAGFALCLFFGLANRLIKSGLIPIQTQTGGFRILQRLLFYGFFLAVVIIILGFSLKFRELSRREQVAAGRLILNELKADREVAGSLAANSATVLEDSMTVAYALRGPASAFLKTLFPYKNLEPDQNTPSPLVMAREQLAAAIAAGLPGSQIELDRMNAVAEAVRGTLMRTQSSLKSLFDADGSRYRISRDAWDANLPLIRRITVVDMTELEHTYADLEQARANYGVLLRYNIGYIETLDEFLAFRRQEINETSLAEVLAAERQYFEVAASYSNAIASEISASGKAITQLSTQLPASDVLGPPDKI